MTSNGGAMGGRAHKPPEMDGAKAIAPGVTNLFVADGSPFPSLPDKNPTLTIMANAWRVADHILERMRRREL